MAQCKLHPLRYLLQTLVLFPQLLWRLGALQLRRQPGWRGSSSRGSGYSRRSLCCCWRGWRTTCGKSGASARRISRNFWSKRCARSNLPSSNRRRSKIKSRKSSKSSKSSNNALRLRSSNSSHAPRLLHSSNALRLLRLLRSSHAPRLLRSSNALRLLRSSNALRLLRSKCTHCVPRSSQRPST